MSLRTVLLALLIGLLLPSALPAQTAPVRLKVGVFDRPPFALKAKDGHWTGLAVDLWAKIADELQIPFDYVETPLDDMIPQLSQGKLDLALGEIGVSAEREKVVDFTQPYLTGAAAVAVPREGRLVKWEDFAAQMMQHDVLSVLILMIVTLILFSFLIWVVEKGIQTGHFSGKPLSGFGSAIWFAAVTMTTVGYGDKTPQTPIGRFLAFFWMFFGIVLVSVFTGAVASSLTVTSLHTGVGRLSELSHYRDGVLQGSLAEAVLSSIGISARGYPSNEAGFKALKKGEITAFVGGEHTLRYMIQHDYPGEFDLLPLPTTRASYAMAARPGLPLFREINIALIARTSVPQWQHDVEHWLGPTEN